jgi:hypothetical protein
MIAIQLRSSALPSEWKVFETVLDAEVLNACCQPAPQEVYTPRVVTWLMVYQRLNGNATLNDAVAHFLLNFPQPAQPDCKRCRDQNVSASTGGYSTARSQLPQTVLEFANQRIFDTLVGSYPPSWQDRRAFILDGTTLTLPPTEELLKAFPPASNQHGASHWPVMHMVVAHELASGLAAQPEYGAMYGPNAVGEVTLATRLLSRLPQWAILLVDRNFGVFSFAYHARQAGHDVVARLTETRFRSMVKKAKRVAENCWWLEWQPSRTDRKTNPDLPPEAKVCGWLHQVPVRADLTLWLFSTVEGTGVELTQLYGKRADVETNIRELKVTLELEQLRGKSESMVVKELWAGLMAYNLALQVRQLAATKAGVQPRELSFAGTWSLMREFMAGLHPGLTEDQVQARFELVLRGAAQRKIPKRKKQRNFPRAVHPRRRKFPEHKRVKKQTT